jgi:hypothetical protein
MLESEIQDVNVALGDAYERGKTDINFFAGLCIPDVCLFALPMFYVAVWSLLTTRTEENLGKLLRFALGLPRGHAKTTFIKIIICWLIVYDKANFILIVCSNSDLAELLLADIHNILLSPNMVSIYGNWRENLAIDSADTKKAAYHNRSVSIVARGWSAGIRGINLQNQRPDVIFCDDVQTRKNDESPTERTNLLTELVGTIFKALAPRGNRLIIYVGNMYSEECILNKFKKMSSWVSMVTGAILESSRPLWPELFSIDELMESYYHDEALGLAHIWFAEVMNDPKSVALSILPHPVPDCDLSDEDLLDPDGSFITIDPAGFRNTSDDNVIVVHLKYQNKGYVVKTVKGILDPAEIIEKTITLAIQYNCCLIGVEDVGYQQTLGFWLTFYINKFKITGLTVVPLKPHGRTKESRIRQFIQELYAKTYFLYSPETRRDFVWQASTYKIGKKEGNKDDLLDAIAYGLDIRNEYWHLIHTLTRKVTIDHGKCNVVAGNTPF